jgi:hypothetical protein
MDVGIAENLEMGPDTKEFYWKSFFNLELLTSQKFQWYEVHLQSLVNCYFFSIVLNNDMYVLCISISLLDAL